VREPRVARLPAKGVAESGACRHRLLRVDDRDRSASRDALMADADGGSRAEKGIRFEAIEAMEALNHRYHRSAYRGNDQICQQRLSCHKDFLHQ